MSRMNKGVKPACAARKEQIQWLNRPITKKFAYLIIDGVYFKVRLPTAGR
jgi:transposase-like protein